MSTVDSVKPPPPPEQRQDQRFACGLVVELEDALGTHELTTTNVSAHGVYVSTDHPHWDGELVLLRLHTGDAEEALEVMGSVAWVKSPDAVGDEGGLGVAFIAISDEDEARWGDLIRDLEQGSGPADPAPTPRRRSPRYISRFFVRIRSRDHFRELYSQNISAGGLFLRTPSPALVPEKVDLVLVHPKTGEEFATAGEVVRKEQEGNPGQRGVAVRFELEPTLEATLLAFIESGVNFLADAGDSDRGRWSLVRKALGLIGEEVQAHVVLGIALLKTDHAEDAMEVFLRALGLDPDSVPALRGLHKAYLELGYLERAEDLLARLRRLS